MKGKSVKKFLSAVLVGTMTASLLAGCGGSSGGGGSEDSKDSESDKAASDSGVDLSGVEAIADIGYEGDPIELLYARRYESCDSGRSGLRYSYFLQCNRRLLPYGSFQTV